MRKALTERCDGSPRVLVVVRGGLVEAVYCEDVCEVGIVDFDGPQGEREAFLGWQDSDAWTEMAPDVDAAINDTEVQG